MSRAHASRSVVALVAAALTWLAPTLARAFVDIQITFQGAGFDDPTPVEPLGGNTGSTLGAQRRLALEYALDTWGSLLDSPVPIAVSASFTNLGCTTRSAVLGLANPSEWVRGPSVGDKTLWYPSALADRLAGRDLSPGQPDIVVELNASVDDPNCRMVVGSWYYGLDGAGVANSNDMIEVVLHEFAHGLGFVSSIDPEFGGSPIADGSDAFSAHILDLDLQQTWDQLTPRQRRTSATNVRRLVWSGAEAQRAAKRYLALGEPRLVLTPAIEGLDIFVGDAAGGLSPAAHPVQGPIVLASPLDGCSPLTNDVRGALVLLEYGTDCSWGTGARAAAEAGAVGALVIVQGPASSPADPLDAPADLVAPLPIPVATLSEPAAAWLAGEIKVHPVVGNLGGDASRLLGADAEGRPLLFASRPALRGSTISHFDSIARPNLLMEPYGQAVAKHEVDLTLAVLHDLGWRSECGNGRVDFDETCDEGTANSDAPGAACRRSCRLAGCGDGVVESGEACDRGPANSDSMPGACRSSCQLAHCGDGVIDPGEACDAGADNSDEAPGACRSDCTRPRCGNGVVEGAEPCDGVDCAPACVPPSAPAQTSDAGAIVPWNDAPSAHADRPVRRSEGGGCSIANAEQRAPTAASPHGWWLLVLTLALLARRLLESRLRARDRAHAGRPPGSVVA